MFIQTPTILERAQPLEIQGRTQDLKKVSKAIE